MSQLLSLWSVPGYSLLAHSTQNWDLPDLLDLVEALFLECHVAVKDELCFLMPTFVREGKSESCRMDYVIVLLLTLEEGYL